MTTASAKEIGAIVSVKHSREIFRKIKNKKVDRVKKFLEGMLDQKTDIEGKHFTKTTAKILDIVESAEANAKNKTMNVEKLFIKDARADKAQRRVLAKSRVPHRGREGKSANLIIEVEER